MPRSNRTLHRRARIDPDDVWTPGDVAQLDAVVAGCAMVAQADGWVTPEERKRMSDRMRNSPTIAFFGIDDVLVLFEALNLRFDRDLDDGEATAEIAVSRLRGQPGPSRLLIETDPPSFQWTPMLAFRSWRGVSDECSTPGVSGIVQA